MKNERESILVVADPEDVKNTGQPDTCPFGKLHWYIVDYQNLHKNFGSIRAEAARHRIDYLFFSRNDQIGARIEIGSLIRMIGTGYSSFSGIDRTDHACQMKACFSDFIRGRGEPEPITDNRSRPVKRGSKRMTFGLVFDCEQLGCAKYGIPRILDLLRRHSIKATFFMTNILNRVYPETAQAVLRDGHRLGLHGLFHERLAGLGHDEQIGRIRDMIDDLAHPATGANFIGRMDQNTISAMCACGLSHFVYPRILYYRFFGYPKLSIFPVRIENSRGAIWALPIAVETYAYPWFSIRNMIDTALSSARETGVGHVTILCHPFRDGSIEHLATTGKMLGYLIARGLTSVSLDEYCLSLNDQGRYSRIPIRDFEPESGSRRLFSPRTVRDLLSFVPEALIRGRRTLNHNRSCF
jgi:peptidoglycan/xylan/chitin deacetylase (PgdA/CDA1 family)